MSDRTEMRLKKAEAQNTLLRETKIERSDQTRTVIVSNELTLKNAIDVLTHRMVQEEEEIAINEAIPVLGTEAMVALARVLKRRYGFVPTKPQRNPFTGEKMPAATKSIQVGIDKKMDVPADNFTLPGMDFIGVGMYPWWIETSSGHNFPGFILRCQTRRKHESEVRAIIEEIKAEVAKNSIYRSHALKLKVDSDGDLKTPDYIDVGATRIDELVFNRDVEAVLGVKVFNPITQTAAIREAGINLNRKVLLSGTYGCGKSLTAKVIAKLCTEHGWTFIMLDDPDHLGKALELARRYEPAVVFVEDLDVAVSGERSQALNDIINTVDGILSKDHEVMMIATTNHVERFNPASVRPGRVDLWLEIPAMDSEAAARLIRKQLGDRLEPNADMDAIGTALAGQVPALVQGVVEDVRLAAIGRTGNAYDWVANTDDVLAAIAGRADHIRLVDQLVERENKVERGPMERAAAILADSPLLATRSNGATPTTN